jgi:hypothetical protein
MAMIDAKLLFQSSAQSITASAASTDTVDFGRARDLGSGEPVDVQTVIGTAFAGAGFTNLRISLQGANASNFSDENTIGEIEVAAASLTAGSVHTLRVSSSGTYRYYRVYYTVVGSNPSAGTVQSAVVWGSGPTGNQVASQRSFA